VAGAVADVSLSRNWDNLQRHVAEAFADPTPRETPALSSPPQHGVLQRPDDIESMNPAPRDELTALPSRPAPPGRSPTLACARDTICGWVFAGTFRANGWDRKRVASSSDLNPIELKGRTFALDDGYPRMPLRDSPPPNGQQLGRSVGCVSRGQRFVVEDMWRGVRGRVWLRVCLFEQRSGQRPPRRSCA
jgi:hypothetical protein